MDYDGRSYIDVADVLFGILQSWQDSIDTTVADFTVAEKFSPTGLRLEGGEAGMDNENKIWTCTESITLYGCVEE